MPSRIDVYSPLRSTATSLTPVLRPKPRTTSSLIGTARLLRGDTLIICRTFGTSYGLAFRPQHRKAAKHPRRGIVDTELINQLSLILGRRALDNLSVAPAD